MWSAHGDLRSAGATEEAADLTCKADLIQRPVDPPVKSIRRVAAWASTVAFYEARNFQRMGARLQLQFSEALMDILAAERVGDMAQTDARHDALGHCLGKLDEAGRKLVEAAYIEGSDIGLLAEQLGRARQTLYNKLNIIRRSLADCVTRRMADERGL